MSKRFLDEIRFHYLRRISNEGRGPEKLNIKLWVLIHLIYKHNWNDYELGSVVGPVIQANGRLTFKETAVILYSISSVTNKMTTFLLVIQICYLAFIAQSYKLVFCCIAAWIQPDISGCQQNFLVVWRWNQLRTF